MGPQVKESAICVGLKTKNKKKPHNPPSRSSNFTFLPQISFRVRFLSTRVLTCCMSDVSLSGFIVSLELASLLSVTLTGGPSCGSVCA